MKNATIALRYMYYTYVAQFVIQLNHLKNIRYARMCFPSYTQLIVDIYHHMYNSLKQNVTVTYMLQKMVYECDSSY